MWYGKSYYRQLIGNHTLAFDWCHFWWPWSTFEGHFSLGCHFHAHFSNSWHAFASHGFPAIAKLLVFIFLRINFKLCPPINFDILSPPLRGFLWCILRNRSCLWTPLFCSIFDTVDVVYSRAGFMQSMGKQARPAIGAAIGGIVFQ